MQLEKRRALLARSLQSIHSLKTLAAAFSLTVAAISAQAQTAPDPHEAQPERPSVATHAGTVAPGWLEAEGGVEFDRAEDHSRGGSAPLVYKIGLARSLQLTVQTPIVHAPGGGSTEIGRAHV